MRTPIVLPVVTAILTFIVGLGALAVGFLLAALAMSGIGRLELPGVGPILGVTVVASAVFGLVAIGAASGLLRDATWSLVAAGTVHAIGALGAIVALASAGPSVPVAIGLALTLGGLAAVMALTVATGSRLAARAG